MKYHFNKKVKKGIYKLFNLLYNACMYVNKSMNEDIKEFGVWELYYNRLRPRPDIQSIYDYNHYLFDLHHYIKAQEYKRNREWFEIYGIQEKLILLPKVIHQHLEYPDYMLDEMEFFKKYHIRKDLLLFNKKRWIHQEVVRIMEKEKKL